MDVIVHEGRVPAMIVCEHVLEHPVLLVTVTLYVPEVFTVIQRFVEPLLHKYE